MKMKIDMSDLLSKNKFVVVLLFLSQHAFAQNNLSLNDAVARTLSNNFGIKIATNQADIAERNNTWGEAGAYPSINLLLSNGNAIADQTNNPTAFIREKLQSNSFGASASLDWTIFGGFRVRTTKEKLDLISQLSDGNADLIIENTIQAVIVAYYAVLLEQERLRIIAELAVLSSDRRDYIRKRMDLGVSGTFESLSFESAALSDSTSLLLQQQQVKTAARNLNLVMGEAVDSEFTLVDDFVLPDLQQDYSSLLAEMQKDNRNLRNQAINRAIAEKDAKLAKSPTYPSLNFSSGFSDTRSQFKAGELEGDGETINYFGNFTIGFNLFNGGKTRRAIQNAMVLEEIAQLNYEQINLNLSADLNRAYEQFRDQSDIYKLASANAALAQTRLDLSKDRFERGLITSLEYRDAQLAYLNASLQAKQSLYSVNLANLEIRRLCGNITEGLN